MFDQIMGRVARRRLTREVRNWLYAVGEFWWPADTFRTMAEENVLPSQLDLPDDVWKLIAGTDLVKVRSVLQIFSDEELLTLLKEGSPSHSHVATTYPVWARAFIQDIRQLLTAGSTVRR